MKPKNNRPPLQFKTAAGATAKLAAVEADASPTTSIDVDLGERDGTVTTRSLDIKTLSDLIRAARVDLQVWEVERHVVNSWEVTIGRKNNDRVKPATFTNFQVKAWLKRIVPTRAENNVARMLRQLTIAAKPVAQRACRHRREHLLELSLFDPHFGLLSWGKETGEPYDCRIALQRYTTAAADLLDKLSAYKPERILLPVGNDFYHINDPSNTTPKSHNSLDVDSRLPKIFDAGFKAVQQTVDLCRRIAPTELIWVPGNHDPETSFFLCKVLAAWYRDCPGEVQVDAGPSPRKYRHYGCNLIGYTHGNEEKHDSLPTLMASEMRDVWPKVRCCEWHLGHFHRAKETRYSAGDTYGNVRVRVIPSLCGTDAWHHRKGYVGGNRVAEAYLYDRHSGLVAQFNSRDTRTL